MKPTTKGPNLNDEELWLPSYGSFDIMTFHYEEKSVLDRMIQRLCD